MCPYLRIFKVIAGFFILAGLAGVASAQPAFFGSADDPSEQIQRVWWKRERTLDLTGGLSLIGAQWRTAGDVSVNAVTRQLSFRLGGTLRAGVYGSYEPDINEPYDALRVLEFARYNAPARRPVYLRAGPIERMQLGTGHLVNFYNSRVAWDERTVGIEAMTQFGAGEIAAFTDNVLLNGVTGGRVTFRPLFWADEPKTRSFQVGMNYVIDLGMANDTSATGLSAYNVEMSFNALESGTVNLTPFATMAWYDQYGSGLGFGADLESPNFIDLARFRLRVALFYNGRGFIPGYVGSFYEVNNPRARILTTVAGKQIDPSMVEGTPLAEAAGGHDLVTELRLLAFERFEFWYYFRRHYGTQNLSDYHLRLFVRPNDKLELETGMDRAGLRSFWSLLNPIDDETALVFRTQYHVAGPLWSFIRARYSFERVGNAPDGTARYLVQRRFEPMAGVRMRF